MVIMHLMHILTYIADLQSLIMNDWSLFTDIFTGKKKEWQDCFEHVSLVRNTMAHHRSLEPRYIRKAEISCIALLDRIKPFL